MSDAIADALAAAQKSAETQAPVTGSQVTEAIKPGMPATSGPSRSLDQFEETAAAGVEAYLGVSELGIQFGKDVKVHEEVLVRFKFSDCKPGWQLRVNAPSGVQYYTTYDGTTEIRTRKNWEALIAEGKRIDDRSYPSDLMEVTARLADTYPRKEGGPIKEDDTVGLSLSYQKVKPFTAFIKKYRPILGDDQEMLVKLTAVAKVGGGNPYGVFAFELIDENALAKEMSGGKASSAKK